MDDVSCQSLKKRRPLLSTSNGRLVEQHYRVDPDHKLLPGVPKHDNDWARDSHDFFNLVMLIPIVVLNMMNWNWDILLDRSSKKTIPEAWTGEWFDVFWKLTAVYFIADLIWVCLIPNCVKSPSTIVKHHIVTLIYIYVPYHSAEYQWCMGACMSVEINTWFLIARRVFNKQGFPPWKIDLPPFISIRVKLISILFYVSWISIRCVLYPYMLVIYAELYEERTQRVGTKWNIMLVPFPLQAVFCVLNFSWTYNLMRSKIRYWRRKERESSVGGNVSDGL